MSGFHVLQPVPRPFGRLPCHSNTEDEVLQNSSLDVESGNPRNSHESGNSSLRQQTEEMKSNDSSNDGEEQFCFRNKNVAKHR